MIEKGHVVEVTIASLAHGGSGVGRYEDFVLIARGGRPAQGGIVTDEALD